jgi:hypothetical protein
MTMLCIMDVHCGRGAGISASFLHAIKRERRALYEDSSRLSARAESLEEF